MLIRKLIYYSKYSSITADINFNHFQIQISVFKITSTSKGFKKYYFIYSDVLFGIYTNILIKSVQLYLHMHYASRRLHCQPWGMRLCHPFPAVPFLGYTRPVWAGCPHYLIQPFYSWLPRPPFPVPGDSAGGYHIPFPLIPSAHMTSILDEKVLWLRRNLFLNLSTTLSTSLFSFP